jgi:hypothetical protein
MPLFKKGNTYGIKEITYYDEMLIMLKEHGMKDECLLWPYAIGNDGYGRVRYNGKTVKVNRIALEYKLGRSILPKLYACHEPIICHNCICFAMAHLYEGTSKQNTFDQIADGTMIYGEKCGTHKLTTEEMLKIREKGATGLFTQKQLAEEYDIHQTQISRILNRKRWPHI